uniref:Uncharacterized protein n=1 Tax=Globodera rostochiensis TaxID=31243 RepID=A0A914I9U9_GLORO
MNARDQIGWTETDGHNKQEEDGDGDEEPGSSSARPIATPKLGDAHLCNIWVTERTAAAKASATSHDGALCLEAIVMNERIGRLEGFGGLGTERLNNLEFNGRNLFGLEEKDFGIRKSISHRWAENDHSTIELFVD